MAMSKKFLKWVDEMEQVYLRDDVSFSKFDNEKVNSKRRKRGYIAIDKKTGKITRSFCNPSDRFEAVIGRAIAYARLRHIEIPPIETYNVKDCIGKIVKYANETYYITPILAYCGAIKVYYCLCFSPKSTYPAASQLCEDMEVELIK